MKTKNRNVLLDVLRGIAGLAVPMLHIQEGYAALIPENWSLSFCGHNYLAVEFYLLLMAYMFGAAYDHRWGDGMSLWDFAKRRIKRLHPLVISGVALSALVFVFQASGIAWAGESSVVGKPLALQIWAFVAGLLMLPAFGFTFISPLNPCSWTLYYQYLGNILYALVVRHMRSWMLAIAAVITALALVVFTFHPDLNAFFGTNCEYFAHLAKHWTSIDGGWGMNDMNYTAGLLRMAFPLFFGLLIFRCGWKLRLPKAVATVVVPLVFIAILFVPAGKGGLFSFTSVWNGVYELAVMWFLLPLLLMISVGSESYGGRFAKIAAFFGELSYPVYMSHFMFLPVHRYCVKHYLVHYSFGVNCLAFAAVYIVLLSVGYVVMKFWERALKK